ncbi:MAG: hypothetical protein KIT73_19430, partial [Burkholderiales bacterium]|nr:hypothetical protein [Burkholderiales bacterium]
MPIAGRTPTAAPHTRVPCPRTDFTRAAVQALSLLLLLLGVGGLVYKALRPGGWISHWLSGFWHVHPGYAALTAIALAAGGYGLKRWLDESSPAGTRGDVLLYAALALGLFFAFELLVNGSI